MSFLKELVVLASVLIFASLGLLGISNPYWSASTPNQSTVNQQENDSRDKKESLEDFLYYLNLIYNKHIDTEKIQSKINSLESEFERTFLSALLKKRTGDYQESYNLLLSLLKDLPKNLSYYEELSYAAKVSGNLEKLSKWISERKDTTNNYLQYLNGLIKYHTGKISESIRIFESLTKKGFVNKEIFYQLANTYRTKGNYDSAIQNLTEAEKLCSDDDTFRSKIINLKGTLYFLSGDFEQSGKEYNYSLGLAKKTGNKVEEIKSIANLAILKDQNGEIESAREDFVNSIKLADEIGNRELLAFLYSELGVSLTYTNNLVDARKNYQKSFSLYEQMGNTERLSYLSSNIGSLYLQISNYKSAFEYYDKGLKYSGENKLGQIFNLTGMADVYSNESNYAKALEFYKRAREIANLLKDISSIVKIDQGIGALYYNINRPIPSLETLKKIESEVSEKELPFEHLQLYSKLGTVYSSLDSFGVAETYLLKGLNIAEETGDIYNSIVLQTELAHNYFLQEKYSEASQVLERAQLEAKKYDLTQVIGLQDLYRGKIYSATNKFKQAEAKLLKAVELSESVKDHNTQIEACYLLGKNFEAMDDMIKAESWYLKSINLIEQISQPLSMNQEIQISHFSGLNDAFNSLIELYLKIGDGKKAFLTIERSRSRNTKINLDKLKLFSELKNTDDIDKLSDLEWMVSSGLYDQIVVDSLQKVINDLKDNLIQKNESLHQILGRNYSFSLKELQEKLGEKDYLISVYISDKFITLFNLNKNDLDFKTIILNRDSLLSMLGSISPIYKSGLTDEELYVNEDLFSFNAFAAYKMYKTIFEKFLSRIPKESHLIVSVPPELVKLPIELLITYWNEDESPYLYSDKKFLLDDYQISYTPSSSIYCLQMEKQRVHNELNLLVGDPYINNSELTLSVRGGLIETTSSHERNIRLYPLKYSEEEIKGIDVTMDNNMVFLSQHATESNFKRYAPISNIVHISSHSFLLKDQPMVLFSPQSDEKDDGFLELGEIVQLRLNSDLVVLSSCRSGLGRLDEAEGIVGMQKAFFEAGCKSVLVTLWDVNDKYTSYFMKDFYKHLAEGMSKAEALRNTKKDFIRKYSANPYYWSAFVLSGNPSGIKVQEASTFQLMPFLLIVLVLGLLFVAFLRIRKYF